jgi:hypothetical protein
MIELFQTEAAKLLGVPECQDLMKCLDTGQFLEARWCVLYEHDRGRIQASECDCLLNMIRSIESGTFARARRTTAAYAATGRLSQN